MQTKVAPNSQRIPSAGTQGVRHSAWLRPCTLIYSSLGILESLNSKVHEASSQPWDLWPAVASLCLDFLKVTQNYNISVYLTRSIGNHIH